MARHRKLLMLSATLIAGVGVALFASWKLDPVAYRTDVFQPVREVTFFFNEMRPLSNWRGIERVRVPDPETVRIAAVGPKDVDIAAAVYPPRGVGRAPTVVLLHGAYPWGRKEGLIRLLAARLSERGWLVVAPDQRGFGASADPRDVNDPESWRTAGDLRRVIDFAIDSAHADPGEVFVIGHSMGANTALEGGLPDGRVKALVLVGPGRHPSGEDLAPPVWERARLAADRHLSKPFSPDLARFVMLLGSIRLSSEPDLARPDHKPILLIDAEWEGRAKLEYLRALVDRMQGPIEYHTLAGAGHYCGVRSFYGSETVFVRPAIFDRFFDLVIEFLERQRAATAARTTPTSP